MIIIAQYYGGSSTFVRRPPRPRPPRSTKRRPSFYVLLIARCVLRETRWHVLIDPLIWQRRRHRRRVFPTVLLVGPRARPRARHASPEKGAKCRARG